MPDLDYTMREGRYSVLRIPGDRPVYQLVEFPVFLGEPVPCAYERQHPDRELGDPLRWPLEAAR